MTLKEKLSLGIAISAIIGAVSLFFYRATTTSNEVYIVLMMLATISFILCTFFLRENILKTNAERHEESTNNQEDIKKESLNTKENIDEVKVRLDDISSNISQEKKQDYQDKLRENWTKIKAVLLSKNKSKHDLSLYVDRFYEPDLNLSKRTLDTHEEAYEVLEDESNKSIQLRRVKYLSLVKMCIKKEKGIFLNELIIKLKSPDWRVFTGYEFLEGIKEQFEKINKSDKDFLLDKSIEHINRYSGRFAEEGYASYVISFLFNHLDNHDFEKLIIAYLEIYCDDSSRSKNYISKQIDDKIYYKVKSNGIRIFRILLPTFISLLKKRKKEELNDEYQNLTAIKLKKSVVNSIYFRYEKIFREDKNAYSDLENEFDKI